jgi:hypothetical protein
LRWENWPVFNFSTSIYSATNAYGGVTVKNNTFYTDYQPWFIQGGVCLNGLDVENNSIFGTSTALWPPNLPPATNAPTPPVIWLANPVMGLKVANNEGYQDTLSDVYMTTLTTSGITNLSWPHGLPRIWISATNAGSYATTNYGIVGVPINSGVNYTVSRMLPQNAASGTIGYAYADYTNVYVTFTAALPTNTPLSYSWMASQSPVFTTSPNTNLTSSMLSALNSYCTRVYADGGRFCQNDIDSLANLLIAIGSTRLSHILELDPFFVPGNSLTVSGSSALLEKLWSQSGYNRLYNWGGRGTIYDSGQVPDINYGDYSARGVKGNAAAYKAFATDLTPSSTTPTGTLGYLGGVHVFVNDASGYVGIANQGLTGVSDSSGSWFNYWSSATGLLGYWGGSTLVTETISNPMVKGLYSLQRHATNALYQYINGVYQNGSGTSTPISTLSTNNFRLLAYTANTNYPTSWSSPQVAFWMFEDGSGLGTSDILAIYNAMTNFNASVFPSRY